jgi:hypothetical protein
MLAMPGRGTRASVPAVINMFLRLLWPPLRSLLRLRAPWSHQTGRLDFSAAKACSMAKTGVAPTPPLRSTTGVADMIPQ